MQDQRRNQSSGMRADFSGWIVSDDDDTVVQFEDEAVQKVQANLYNPHASKQLKFP